MATFAFENLNRSKAPMLSQYWKWMIYSIYSILAQGQTSKPLPIFCYMKGISIEIGNLRGPVSWPMNHKYCQQSFRNPFFHIDYNEPKKFPVSSIYDLTPYVDQFSCNNREAFPIYLYPHSLCRPVQL